MARIWPLLILSLAASLGAAGADVATSTVLEAARPVTLCLADAAPKGAADAAGLRRRPVLVVHAQNGGSLSVLADSGEASRIGLFPGTPFNSAGGAGAQRFFLPGGPKTRCWQITPLDGGTVARIGLEMSQPLE